MSDLAAVLKKKINIIKSKIKDHIGLQQIFFFHFTEKKKGLQTLT